MITTWYHRSDQHTINGLTAYKLLVTNTTSELTFHIIQPQATAYYRSDIYVRHLNGSETLIEANVAQTLRSAPGSG
ncbi:unnamed protein product, partial [marine sediment metagenome]